MITKVFVFIEAHNSKLMDLGYELTVSKNCPMQIPLIGQHWAKI